MAVGFSSERGGTWMVTRTGIGSFRSEVISSLKTEGNGVRLKGAGGEIGIGGKGGGGRERE